MEATQLLPIFLVGLAGSVHCVGMCGGIVGALSAAQAPSARPDPRSAPPGDARSAGQAQPTTPAGATASTGRPPRSESIAKAPRLRATIAITPARGESRLLRIAAYNSGRIASYMVAGALAGGLVGGAAQLAHIASLQLLLYWLANLMLVALGLYLMDAWHGLTRLETLGQRLWRRFVPLLQWLLPMDSPLKALALGGVWGWVPCGMVYSVLLTALLSGSAAGGAAVMLAFGLGTLPMLIGLGLIGARLRLALQRPGVRRACGLLVLGFGILGLARASAGMSLGWLDALCLTTHP